MFLGREPLRHRAARRDAMELTAKETLADLSVTTVRSIRQPVGSLSGGQRQAVAVARAVMRDAKLVIMDEPTAALGVAQTAMVLDLIERLAEQRRRRARDLAQPQRRLRGRRPHRGPLPRPPRRERPGLGLRHARARSSSSRPAPSAPARRHGGRRRTPRAGGVTHGLRPADDPTRRGSRRAGGSSSRDSRPIRPAATPVALIGADRSLAELQRVRRRPGARRVRPARAACCRSSPG